MLPCIKENNLSIFAATADQRFMLGEELFLRTHFPVEMRRYRPGGQVTTWTEKDLLGEIMSVYEGSVGNRTFVLYGAAGSGKSEMIRWIEYHAGKSNRRPYVLRISRTELDPVRILEKILVKFNGVDLGDSIHHQWEDLRKKPITLANHLVWASLGKMLSSDSEVIPLSYQLRPLIENNLRLNFSGIDHPSEFQGRTAELISLEEMEDLVRQCPIPLNINCEQLRFEMARELERSILGGYNFVETLRSISQELMAKTGIRPLLLIDDLVQSMNLYSTDLLDFFITMEEGNWDTVLGLTPASFETSKRGREILGRITNLDTFDDRLIKLWLTDEQGHFSYFINIENCHIFAERYISEYKRLGGYSCEKCALVSNCTELQMGMANDASLSPFNQAFLKRVYKSLPRGKGKARYFIMTMGEILKKIALGDINGALESYIEREISVDHPDSIVRLIGEAYAPEYVKNEGVINIDGSALSIFLDSEGRGGQSITAPISNLSSMRAQIIGMSDDLYEERSELNTGKAAIRDWIEGREVNKELLKGIRLGIAHICRELSQPCNIIPPNTARLSPVLRWDESIEGCKIPMSFEGIDSFEGVKVPRALGHAAYTLNYIHLKRGQGKEVLLEEILQSSDQLHYIIYDAEKLKYKLSSTLEKEMGMTIYELAYILFILLMEFGQGGDEIPALIYKDYHGKGQDYPESLKNIQLLFPEEMCLAIRNLFKDWFILRESIYNAIHLAEMKKKFKDVDPIILIFTIDPLKISHQYKIGETELRLFISNVQSILNNLVTCLRGDMSLREKERVRKILELLHLLKHPNEHVEISTALTSIARDVDRPKPDLPDWQVCSKLQTKVKRSLRTYIGRNESLKVESPIDIHRFLNVIGLLEQDEDFKSLKEVCIYLEDAEALICDAQNKLQEEAENMGLMGHLARNTEWGNKVTLINLEDEDNLEYILSLSNTAARYSRCREYLRVLSQASPYINHQLYGECKDVSRILENVLSQLSGMPGLSENIASVRERCLEYCKAVDSLLLLDNYNYLNETLISQIVNLYRDLSPGMLRDMLLSSANKWANHIRKLSQIAVCLKFEFDKTMTQNVLGQLDRLRQLNLTTEIAQRLVDIAGSLLIFSNSSVLDRVVGNELGGERALDILLRPVPMELLLTDNMLEEIWNFIKKYPDLSKLVKVKIYLS